tara:strand:+ start:142 stop:570 length:429 start_codon:yes stop_codon:yes gene_type:complete
MAYTINQYNVHNAGLYWHIDRYPRTGAARYWLDQYKNYKEWEGQEPTTLTVHNVWQNYGGPEEGGWWYTAGGPVSSPFWIGDKSTICIYNKKQAVREAIELTKKWRLHEQPSTTDSRELGAIEVNFSNGYAKYFPEERPRYE